MRRDQMVKTSPMMKRRSDLLRCHRLGAGMANPLAADGSTDAFSEHLVHKMAGIGLYPESDLTSASTVRCPDDAAFLGKIPTALVNQVPELGTDVCQHVGSAGKAVGLA